MASIPSYSIRTNWRGTIGLNLWASRTSFLGVPSVVLIVLTTLQFYTVSGWRDTTPNVNTPTPGYRFLWTHRNGDDVFCDMIVHPGVDNRVLYLDDKKFAIQMRLPDKYDHNFEFLKYLSWLLWLTPSEIQVVRGKTKMLKRLQFINPNPRAGIDIDFYRSIFSRIQKEHLDPDRCYQTESNTPHAVFPVSSTKQIYGIMGPTPRPIHYRNPRIALLAGPNYWPELMRVGVQEEWELSKNGTKKTTKVTPPTRFIPYDLKERGFLRESKVKYTLFRESGGY
uniref:Uncharacterized protein n=1 Tax=Cacopsylla melanoneura TaxID=428564 RepID=A0A8D9EGF4_9HEMI